MCIIIKNVRIDSIKAKGLDIHITYSRTTYFDSLITNRAMDYKLADGKSVREIYEPGPFLHSLEESKLSNHLGFNGFIEIADERVILIKRSGHLSTSKDSWSPSVSASFKSCYGIDNNGRLSLEGISNAIAMEVQDELKISLPDTKGLYNSIIGFYRDLIEGGKLHFVFDIKLPTLTADEFSKTFGDAVKEQGVKDVIMDGSKFTLIKKSELLGANIWMNGFEIGRRRYNMSPQLLIALAMWVDYNKRL